MTLIAEAYVRTFGLGGTYPGNLQFSTYPPETGLPTGLYISVKTASQYHTRLHLA